MITKPPTMPPATPATGLTPDPDRLLADTELLMKQPADRAYDAGVNLKAIRDGRIFLHAGASSFDEFVKAKGFSASVARSNIKLVETFERSDMAAGVSKLRALLHAKVADPKAVLAAGIPRAGDRIVSIATASYREVAAWVRDLPAHRKSVAAEETSDALEGLLGTDPAAAAK